MYPSSLFVLLCTLYAATVTLAAPALEDIFAGFVKNANLKSPEKNGEVVKRFVFEGNNDAGLKQVSLQSLIGDLEQTLYKSAASAHSSINQQKAVTISPADDHPITKRDTEADTAHSSDKGAATPTPTPAPADKDQIIKQTTENVPEKDGKPAHILIDRISVQPHVGGLQTIVPAFQVQHTKLISATFQDQGSGKGPTQITITKTNIQATGSEAPPTTEQHTSEKAAEATSPSSAAESTSAEPTTKKPSVELKKAEEELKEKVAEIEAEPVILSARV